MSAEEEVLSILAKAKRVMLSSQTPAHVQTAKRYAVLADQRIAELSKPAQSQASRIIGIFTSILKR